MINPSTLSWIQPKLALLSPQKKKPSSATTYNALSQHYPISFKPSWHLRPNDRENLNTNFWSNDIGKFYSIWRGISKKQVLSSLERRNSWSSLQERTLPHKEMQMNKTKPCNTWCENAITLWILSMHLQLSFIKPQKFIPTFDRRACPWEASRERYSASHPTYQDSTDWSKTFGDEEVGMIWFYRGSLQLASYSLSGIYLGKTSFS